MMYGKNTNTNLNNSNDQHVSKDKLHTSNILVIKLYDQIK